MVTDASKPLAPLVDRSPARRSLIAELRRNVHRLRSRTETVSVARNKPDQAVRSSCTIVFDRDPTSIEAAEMLPALTSDGLPRERFVKRLRGTVGFRFGVPSHLAMLAHSLPVSRCQFMGAAARGGFDWDEAAPNPGVFCEAEVRSVMADICRKPG